MSALDNLREALKGKERGWHKPIYLEDPETGQRVISGVQRQLAQVFPEDIIEVARAVGEGDDVVDALRRGCTRAKNRAVTIEADHLFHLVEKAGGKPAIAEG